MEYYLFIFGIIGGCICCVIINRIRKKEIWIYEFCEEGWFFGIVGNEFF